MSLSEPTTLEQKASETRAEVYVPGDMLTLININPVDGLEHFLKAVEGQGRQGRIKCDGRSVLLVSPGVPHESAGVRIDMMLREVFDVLDISTRSMASTLYRLTEPDRNKAIEPDTSYYIQNVGKVLGRNEMDLSVTPPPDLVVEVVDKNPAMRALGISLALRVPEVWVYKVRTQSLVFYGLTRGPGQPDSYAALERSRVLPFLRPEDVAPWGALTDEDDKDFRRRARAWVETELLPRYRAGGAGA